MKNQCVMRSFTTCRDGDVQRIRTIEKRFIVQGSVGFAVAECDLPKFSGTIIPVFKPNRECERMGFRVPCMVHAGAPLGPVPKNELKRPYCIVAEMTKDAEKAAARKGAPVIPHQEGHLLANLEVSVFEKQGIANPPRTKLP